MEQFKYSKKECQQAVIVLVESKLLTDDEADDILALIDYSKRLREDN